jgi:predicted DNA-binding transcriptional regulator AlpA
MRRNSMESMSELGSDRSIEIMTAKEVASFLKISVKTVYSYARRSMLPTYWKFQNNVRFERGQILEWMKTRNQATPMKARKPAA